MADVLGILKGTLDPGTKKVKKDDFKTKVEAEITRLSAGTPDEQAQAKVLQNLLDKDTFVKMDLNGDGDISEDELNRSGNIDGKPEFTIEDTRALKRRPAVRTVTDESKLDKIPVQLRLSMRTLTIDNGGYLQADYQNVAGDKPRDTYILPPIEIKEPDPTDSTKTITNNFSPFIGIDNRLYITGYEGDYKVGADGKDTTDLFEYGIPLKELQTYCAFNPKERVWLRVPGMNFYSATFAQDDSKDIPNFPPIDVSTPEGKEKLAEYIKKHLLTDSTGKSDYSKLQQFKGAIYHEGIGAKGLRQSQLQPAN